MSEIKDDGGPAFPRKRSQHADVRSGGIIEDPPQDGMSLRDWFAGQALAGLLGNQHAYSSGAPVDFARWAYENADAMLKERAK